MATKVKSKSKSKSKAKAKEKAKAPKAQKPVKKSPKKTTRPVEDAALIDPKNTYMIDVNELTFDDRLQFRLGTGPHNTDKETVESYAELMKEGVSFPPCRVIELSEAFEDYEATTLIVVGGFTRGMAARLAGKDLLVTVTSGTWEDARMLAFKENNDHGKRRTWKETQGVLEEIERTYPGKSLAEVSRMAGCSKSAVWKFRNPDYGKKEEQPTPPTPATSPPREPEPEASTVDTHETPEPQAEPETDSTSHDIDTVDFDVPAQIDPYAAIKRGRRTALALASQLKQTLKGIEEWKNKPDEGSRLIKYGVCEKALQEAIRHLERMCPLVIVPPEALEALGGKDPTDGHGWLHDLGAERLPQEVREKCINL